MNTTPNHFAKNIFRWLLIRLAVMYCVALVVLPTLWAVLPEQPWWLTIVDHVFAPFIFIPLAPLLFGAFVWRIRSLNIPATAALVACVVTLHGPLLPRSTPNVLGMPLQVATYNHLYANGQPDDVLATIRNQNADVVAIQELSSTVANLLLTRMHDQYPYQSHEPAENASGLGLLSRFPIETTTLDPQYHGQRVVVRMANQRVTIINVHPNTPFVYSGRGGWRGAITSLQTYGTGPRQQQIATLLATIDATPGPLIVLGDFNTSDRDPLYQTLAARLRDAYRETAWGLGATFPNFVRVGPLVVPPLVRIDYIWTRNGIVPQATRVECNSGGSDHCLLVADLVLE